MAVALLGVAPGACGKAPSAAPTSQDKDPVDKAYVMTMLFDNNPSGRTIAGMTDWTQVFIDDDCFQVGDVDGPRWGKHPFFEPYGFNALSALTDVIDNTTLRVTIWQGHVLPRELWGYTQANLVCPDPERMARLFPGKTFRYRNMFFYTKPELYRRALAALPRNDAHHIGRASGRGCYNYLATGPDNGMRDANSYVLLDGDTFRAAEKPEVQICLLRGTLASYGLTGILTYPRKKFIVEEVLRINKGPLAMPFWNLSPYVAMKYNRPSGSTKQQVETRLTADGRE